MPMGSATRGSVSCRPSALRFSTAKSAYLNQPNSPSEVRMDSARNSFALGVPLISWMEKNPHLREYLANRR